MHKVANSCQPGEWQVWRTDRLADVNTRWSNRPALLQHMGSSTGPGDGGGCTGTWVKADLTALYQYMADRSQNAFTAALVPLSDSNNLYYKEFKSTESGTLPHVSLNWNEPPTVSGLTTSPTTACITGSGRPYVTSRTPRLSAVVSDSDAAPSNVQFEWWVTNGAQIGGTTVNGVPSGSFASADVAQGAFSEGGTYSWRVRAVDPSGQPVGAWSQWCEFTVDTVRPGVPSVSSTTYPDDGGWHGQYNQAGQFTFTPAAGTTDLAAFEYQLDTATSRTTVNATAATTVSITPPEDGTRTLKVWAKDKAGNLSDPYTYTFKVGRAGLTQPGAGANVVKRTKLAIDGDATYTRVRFQYRRGPGATEYDIPLVNLQTATGGAVTYNPVRLSELGAHAV